MSQPGGPSTGGASGYFGLTFASANLGYGLNMFYYLRTDPLTGTTKFGALPPGLAGAPADQFDLHATGHSALAFVGTDVGYGFNKMYYTRLDSITGFTILGTLDPVSGRVADIANLGSVYTTLTYVPGDVGYGAGKFYTTGSVNPTWQSVSFAAIADRLMSEGSFTVNPTASSALPIALTVVTGSATISSPVGGVFTGTPTAPGLITLQATQAGQSGAFEANMLRQSFTVNTIAPSSRLVNFSARATSGPGAATLIMGFVVSGNGKNLLVRGVGPTLSNYGVVNSLVDPMLTVFGPSGAIAVNDDWQTPMTQPSGSPAAASGSVLASTAAQVGAFALPSGSKDSALLITVSNLILTTSFARANATTGVALTEIYDTDTVLGARLVNVSARMNVSAGEGTLIGGFVIFGNAPKTVLIRGVGPTLANYSVTGVLADPAITVYASGSLMASNDNWEVGNVTPTQLINASAAVGAFALPTGSKDAALLLTLQPGIYSVHVTGVGNTTGVALVEVYDTQ